MMRRRAALAEHPFGTLKCRAGYRHFLVRGFDKVRGEWSLMALCYNFTRVLNILGIDTVPGLLGQERHDWTGLICSSPLLSPVARRLVGRPLRASQPDTSRNASDLRDAFRCA